MSFDKPKNFLLYCSLTGEEYNQVRPMIWVRNRRIVKYTATLAASMGMLFFLVNRLTDSAVLFPYLFLFCGSFLILLLHPLGRRIRDESFSMFLCYAEMFMLCAYAGILSTQPSNYAVPATSFIVFVVILPQTIDDRPLRMYLMMLTESAVYLLVSRLLKSPEAFSLDVLNMAIFCVIGMVIYSVICIRNVREIYQGVRMEKLQKGIISSLAAVVEERDAETGDHILRTESLVQVLIDAMKMQAGYSHLKDDFFQNVILAAPMHDIGKIRIPDEILNKPGKLTPDEFDVMKQHTVFGEAIIRKTMLGVEEEAYLRIACNIARHHHERFDGTGYPDGLKGEEIPLEARIMALADVYDALISKRVYKEAYSEAEAMVIIREGAGTQFDQELVPLFLDAISRSPAISELKRELPCKEWEKQ